MASYAKKELFIARFDANGNRIWATYFGGDAATHIVNIKGDAYGNIYIYGITGSSIKWVHRVPTNHNMMAQAKLF